MEKKKPHHRIMVTLPSEVDSIVRDRAKDDERAISAQVVRMLRKCIKLEQELEQKTA